MRDSIDLSEKLATFSEHFSPRTVAQFNNFDVMVVKLKGEFVWHKRDDTDDFFLVLKGVLDIQLRDRNRAPAGRHSQPDLSQFGGRLSFAPAQFHPSSVLRASELQRMDATLAAPGCWVCSTWCRTPAMNLYGICRLANLSLRSTASVHATSSTRGNSSTMKVSMTLCADPSLSISSAIRGRCMKF
jgi:hypothetical protein